ncbi:predicted protein [Histoplasma capsulatum H143]|uniref:Uncharacterized protein n=1 Tax=Ajellomyces capsulatus (strain H143) TaxID=544712 RepID=C6HSW4_AJECH|nr:predicted protein [Histoplasma capsulatum H143]
MTARIVVTFAAHTTSRTAPSYGGTSRRGNLENTLTLWMIPYVEYLKFVYFKEFDQLEHIPEFRRTQPELTSSQKINIHKNSCEVEVGVNLETTSTCCIEWHWFTWRADVCNIGLSNYHDWV